MEPISLSTILAAIAGAIATAYGTYKTMKNKEDARVQDKAALLAAEESAWRKEILAEADRLRDRIEKMQEQIDKLIEERSRAQDEIISLHRKVSDLEYTIESLKRIKNDPIASS